MSTLTFIIMETLLVIGLSIVITLFVKDMNEKEHERKQSLEKLTKLMTEENKD